MRYLIFALFLSLQLEAQKLNYPGKIWEEKKPESQSVNSQKLQEAIDFALINENSVEKDLRIAITKSFGREPGFQIKGPTKRRGEPNGLIIKNGYIESYKKVLETDPNITNNIIGSHIAQMQWELIDFLKLSSSRNADSLII